MGEDYDESVSMANFKRLFKLTIKVVFVGYILVCCAALLHHNLFRKIEKNKVLANTAAKPVRGNFPPQVQARTYNPQLFSKWASRTEQFCGGTITSFSDTIICFRKITVNPKLATALAKPGINATQVLQQAEEDELYKFQPGFFQIHCKTDSLGRISRHGRTHVHGIWEAALKVNTDSPSPVSAQDSQSGLTIALQRNEYANVYWTLLDVYDIYLTCNFLNHSTENTSVLLVDARPQGNLDSLWNIFRSVERLSSLNSSVTYDVLNWRFNRAQSPLLEYVLTPLPLGKEFRYFVFSSYHLSRVHTRDCGKLNIFFLWRRDYIAHPRNPSGKVSRKIKNENQLLRETSQAFPNHNITGLQLDSLHIRKQIEIISHTDIFIGMHGAGMTFSMFLPDNSAVVEMFPAYYKSPNWHMEYVARRSGHTYIKWKSTDHTLDDMDTESTTVPIDIIAPLVKKAINKICSR